MDPKIMSDRFYLWWHCPINQSRQMAGVAYYNKQSGDYRLIINFFPDHQYFLKCLGGTEESCHYRLLSVRKRGGKGSRFFQGEGVLVNSTREIVIQTAPFSKWLIVSLGEDSPSSNPRGHI